MQSPENALAVAQEAKVPIEQVVEASFAERVEVARGKKSATGKAGKIGFSVEVNPDVPGKINKFMTEVVEGKSGWGLGGTVRKGTLKARQTMYAVSRKPQAAGSRITEFGKGIAKDVRDLAPVEKVYLDELAQTADPKAFKQIQETARADKDVHFAKLDAAVRRVKHFENFAGKVYVDLGVMDEATRAKWRDRHLCRSFFAHLREEEWLTKLERTDPEKAARIRSDIESSGQPLGSGATRRLHERKDLSEEAQEFLNRVDDPETRFAQDVETLANIVAARGTQAALARQYGKSSYQAAEKAYGQDVLLMPATVDFVGGVKKSAKTYYGDMAGKWFPGTMVRDMMVRPNLLDQPPKVVRGGVGYLKRNLAAANPTVLLTNLLSNAPLAALEAGYHAYNPVHWGSAFREALEHSRTGKMHPDFRQMSKEVPDLLSKSIRPEIADAAAKAFDATSGPPGQKMLAAAKVLYDAPGEFYSFMENWAKLATYKALKAGKLAPTEAALRASRAIFDYGDIPRYLKVARNYGISYFPTFFYKVTRQMARHPLRTAAGVAGIAGAKAAVESLTPSDQLKDERRKLGNAAQGIRLPGEKPRYLDINNMLPWGQLARDAPTGTLGKVSGFMGLPGAIIESPLFRGRSMYTGKDIVPQGAGPATLKQAWASWLWERSGVIPPFIGRGAERVALAARGGRKFGYEPLSVGEAATTALTPIKISRPKVSEQVILQTSQVERKIREMMELRRKVIRSRETEKPTKAQIARQDARFKADREALQREVDRLNKRLGLHLRVPVSAGGSRQPTQFTNPYARR
jgi:hypothetical protein